MKRVYVFYIVTLGSFFAALLAIFSMLGVGGAPKAKEGEYVSAVAARPPEPVLFTGHLDYPDLVPEKMYTVSHGTPIASDPEGVIGRTEELPPGGIFQVDGREQSGSDLWYRVTVNNGRTDYTMYLKAEDLNWKTVELVRTEETEAVASREEAMRLLVEHFGAGRGEVAQAEPEPEPEPEPETMERVWAAMQSRATILFAGGMWTAALAAGIVTLAIAFAIGIVVWSYNVRRWHTSGISEEPAPSRGEEFYEEDEPMDEPGDEF